MKTLAYVITYQSLRQVERDSPPQVAVMDSGLWMLRFGEG